MSEPRSSRWHEIRRLIAEVVNLPEEDLGLNPSQYRTPGWDSLVSIVVIQAVEEAFEVSISDEEAYNATSLEGLEELLQNREVADRRTDTDAVRGLEPS